MRTIASIKRSIVLVCLFFAGSSYSSLKAQDPVWVETSDVKEVKIYQQGALVTRSAKAMIEAGFREVVIDGLSPYINPQSINLKGSGDATILSVNYQMNYLKEKKKSKEITALEADLDSLQYRHQLLLNRMAAINETMTLLQANKSVGGANNGVIADELEPVAEYFLKKFNELKDDHLANSVKEKKLKEKIDKIQQQLALLRSKLNQNTGSIVVRLEARSRHTASFDFSYAVVSNVNWYAFYDLKVKDAGSPVQLVYKAKVSQTTGEDWDKARILLSTGNPSMGNDRPQLYPWYLNFIQPQVLSNYMTRSMDMAIPAAVPESGAKKTEADAEQAMQQVAVNMNQQTLTSIFEISSPYSIPSDGKEYQIDIQNYSLPAQYQYITVPKMDPDAFLTARVTGWEDLGLSPGNANVYFEGTYVGESYLNAFEINDTLEVSLGRDKQIMVKREKLKDLSGSKLFGGNKVRSLSYELTVRNTKKSPVTLVLLEQIPLSQQKDIEVKIMESDNAQINQDNGEVKWILSLAAGESQKKRLQFSVKYPQGKVVGGL